MQASKLVIGETYAIRSGNRLVDFKLREIVTTRTGNGPSGLASKVRGLVDGAQELCHPFDVEHVLGPAAEYRELMERRRQEQAAKEAREAATAGKRQLAISWLGQRGIAAEAHYDGIKIKDAALVAFIENLVEPAGQ